MLLSLSLASLSDRRTVLSFACYDISEECFHHDISPARSLAVAGKRKNNGTIGKRRQIIGLTTSSAHQTETKHAIKKNCGSIIKVKWGIVK